MLFISSLAPKIPAPEIGRDWRAPVLDTATTIEAKSASADEQTRTRPIFMKTRRPFVAKAGSAKDAPESAGAPSLPAGLSLRAIVSQGQKMKRVFAVSNATREGKWLKVGDEFEGWTVVAAQSLKVTMRKDEFVAELPFDYALSQPPGGGAKLAETRLQTKEAQDLALKPINAIRHGAI